WVVPFQQVNDAQAMIAMTNSIRSGGGTDILAGLRLVERDIKEEPSQLKHLILLTDGGANSTGLVELTESLHAEHGVTLSSIAIGRNPGAFLQPMAEAGQGNYYRVANVEEIPLIFAQETVLASRSYIVEETFTPRVTGSSAILDGIGALPPLRGYVASTPKTAAQRILSGPEPYADPILAAWQYGLGRVVAFTADANARWANEWVVWEDFSRFWGQAVTWSINAGANENLETSIVLEDERARIVVDARDETGGFLDGLALDGAVLNPNGNSLRLGLQQTAPGRYEASFRPGREGAYFLNISGEAAAEAGAAPLTDLKGWVRSYSPEYLPHTGGEALLADLAEATGGRNLADAPQAVFAHNLGERQAANDIWESLILLALLLLPLDIALRRLIITRGDLQRLRAFATGRGTRQARSQQMQALFSARSRSRETTGYGADLPDGLRPPAGDSPAPVSQQASPRRSAREPEFMQPPDDQPNLGARLLERKGRRSD
ncbi:MAG: glutamine amidotransferase, partial [Chloroflexi bacterium]|nr:glutamine amidotransferase [Chloroflexota bacterium]